MKKFWIVMLAVAMFLAFTAPVIAAVGGVDVEFSGTYRVRGWYDDNIGYDSAFAKTNGGKDHNKGQAFYDNRLRLQTTFKVAEGLKLVTRFDALEKKWGQNLNYAGNTAIPANNNNDNIAFERAYVSFTTGLGTLNVGYQDWQRFGTQFVDSDLTYPGIKYINSFGPLTILAGIEKRSETQKTNPAPPVVKTGNQAYNSGYMDIDTDVYDLGFIFKFKGGDAGLLYQYYHVNEISQKETQIANAYRQSIHLFDAYGKYKFGPVYVEAEGFLVTGTFKDFSGNPRLAYQNIALSAYGFYLNAEVEFKPAYAGFKYVYVTGDDGESDLAGYDRTRRGSVTGALTLGQDHDFALMIGNFEYFNQITGASGWAAPNTVGTVNYSMENINAWQIYVGVKPTPKMDVRLAFTDAYVQTVPKYIGANLVTQSISNHIGSEIDLRASYKIFDNLTYSVGAAYFFTGDYFKGLNADTYKITNDYLLMHQLLLSF